MQLIDAQRHRVLTRIRLGAAHKPVGMVLSPDEKTVYYAETMSGRLFGAKIGKPGELAKGAGLLPGGVYVGQTPGYALYD